MMPIKVAITTLNADFPGAFYSLKLTRKKREDGFLGEASSLFISLTLGE
jgi:hypothetical protein